MGWGEVGWGELLKRHLLSRGCPPGRRNRGRKEPAEPSHPPPQGGSGAAGGFLKFGASTCELVPGNRSPGELWSVEPVLQMGKLRRLQGSLAFGGAVD